VKTDPVVVTQQRNLLMLVIGQSVSITAMIMTVITTNTTEATNAVRAVGEHLMTLKTTKRVSVVAPMALGGVKTLLLSRPFLEIAR
jgi:hypothetical protein